MIEKITYMSYDGQEFADEEDCLAYEISKDVAKRQISIFNDKSIEISPEDFMRCENEAQYIVIGNDESAEWFNKYINDCITGVVYDGVQTFEKGGYYFNYNDGLWYSENELKCKIKGIQDIIDFFRVKSKEFDNKDGEKGE